MLFQGFSEEDFDVFKIDGLEQRMEGIIGTIRPKLEWLGTHFTPYLSALTGDEMFHHTAKHARRTVNPPKDTWVAWSNQKRGYKMVPHFQIGLWESHLFIWFAVIYEAPSKSAYAEKLLASLPRIFEETPEDFLWSWDHTRTEVYPHRDLEISDLRHAFERLSQVKKAEVLCGINIDRHDPLLQNSALLQRKIENTFTQLMLLYKL